MLILPPLYGAVLFCIVTALMRTGATYIAQVVGYAPGLFRLSGGLFVVLTKALRPRLHRRCFVLPGRLLLFTACFAAWRERPSGPDRGLVRPAAYVLPAEGGEPPGGARGKKVKGR